jgi:hypothetical protein
LDSLNITGLSNIKAIKFGIAIKPFMTDATVQTNLTLDDAQAPIIINTIHSNLYGLIDF